MKRIAIAAVDDDWGIGKAGNLPWDYMEDRKYFKSCTLNTVCIMGRKTYEDLTTYFKGDTLMPGRFPIVVSESMQKYAIPVTYANVRVAGSMESALTIAQEIISKTDNMCHDVCFIGGSSIYQYAMQNDLVDEVLLSHIPGTHDCDTFFPRSDMDGYVQTFYDISAATGIGYAVYARRKPPHA